MKLKSILVLAGVCMSLCIGISHLEAQEEQQPNQRQGGRGGFDPAQFQQRIMERVREQFDVKSDDEWKVIEERLQKVMQARMDVGFGGFGFGGFGRGGRRDGGGNTQPGGDNQNQGGRGGSLFQQSAEAEALQKAIDSKGSADELKAAIAKLRAARKDKEAALDKAQEELRKVLSVRQEAIAVMLGFLK
jgi:hypothetical protein